MAKNQAEIMNDMGGLWALSACEKGISDNRVNNERAT